MDGSCRPRYKQKQRPGTDISMYTIMSVALFLEKRVFQLSMFNKSLKIELF